MEQVGDPCGGSAGQVCQADGTCACNAASCGGTTLICNGGVCVPCSGDHPCPDGCCQPDGTCSATCRVFATRSAHTGKLGGLAGGDAICQVLAGAAGLPGLYFAWLSDGTDSPSTRFPLAGDPDIGPFVLVGSPAATIAVDWTALTSRATCQQGQSGACLDQSIDRDQTGTGLAAPLTAWTGTTIHGTTYAVAATCAGWTNETRAELANAGETNKSDCRWTASFGPGCQSSHRLYCFQQG